jgi:hypothetical protein
VAERYGGSGVPLHDKAATMRVAPEPSGITAG